MNDETVNLAAVRAPADVPAPISAGASVSWNWRATRIEEAVRIVLLALAAVFFLLHVLHLNADFPNHSPWDDWAKYTDEGWYGDAAIRHYLTGHWYWKGDFNPAVALPVWPALELLVFRFTGVSPAAARALTLCVFALTLLSVYRLITLHTRSRNGVPLGSLAAPLSVLLLCASPFVYVFERMAILEPLLILLGILALISASNLHPYPFRAVYDRKNWRRLLPTVALTLLLPGMVLTKTTAICLLPAIAYMVWARADYRWRPALRLAAIPAVLGTVLWGVYLFVFVRPHYLEDYRYLFFANAHTGVDQPLASTVLDTLGDFVWIGLGLYIAFLAVLALAIFWRPRFFANPLAPSLLLWIGGYTAFLIYHNSLQPRYYLVLAVPITIIVCLGLDLLRNPGESSQRDAATEAETAVLPAVLRQHPAPAAAMIAGSLLVAAAVLAIVIPDALVQLNFVRHPTYDFAAAAQSIKRIVLADKTHPDLVLGISGSDLTLMTGLPSIDDDYGTLDLDTRAARYRPGWFVAWNQVDDDKADALSPLFRLKRVAEFPVMDDPDRNLLILYRLDPVPSEQGPAGPHQRRLRSKTLAARITLQPPGARKPQR